MRRRNALHSLLGTALATLAFRANAQVPSNNRIQVWKDPHCGCCQDWVAHLQAHGFTVQVFESGNTSMRHKLGMPMAYASCHTAVVQGYVIEGHVPASDIRRLLAQRPKALGLSVPGMPVGSPGMDGPAYAGRKDPYDTLLVQHDGSQQVFASHNRL